MKQATKWANYLLGKSINKINETTKAQLEEAGLCAVISVQGSHTFKIGATYEPTMKRLASRSLNGYVTDGIILDAYIFGSHDSTSSEL